MQLSDCLSEDPRLISPFLAILGTSIQKIRAIKPFQAFSLERVGTVGTIPERSEDHLPNMDDIQTFAKRTESHIDQQQSVIAWMKLLPYFFGDLFMLLSVMFIFAGTVLLLGPWRRPQNKGM